MSLPYITITMWDLQPAPSFTRSADSVRDGLKNSETWLKDQWFRAKGTLTSWCEPRMPSRHICAWIKRGRHEMACRGCSMGDTLLPALKICWYPRNWWSMVKDDLISGTWIWPYDQRIHQRMGDESAKELVGSFVADLRPWPNNFGQTKQVCLKLRRYLAKITHPSELQNTIIPKAVCWGNLSRLLHDDVVYSPSEVWKGQNQRLRNRNARNRGWWKRNVFLSLGDATVFKSGDVSVWPTKDCLTGWSNAWMMDSRSAMATTQMEEKVPRGRQTNCDCQGLIPGESRTAFDWFNVGSFLRQDLRLGKHWSLKKRTNRCPEMCHLFVSTIVQFSGCRCPKFSQWSAPLLEVDPMEAHRDF